MKDKFKLYDFIVMMYIIFIFSFENDTYSLIFSIVQIVFIVFTMFIILKRKKVTLNKYIICQIALLIIALIIEMIKMYYGHKINNEIYIFAGNIIKITLLIQYFTSKEKIDRFILFMIIGGVITSIFVITEYFSVSSTLIYDLKYTSNYRVGASISGGNVNITALNLCISFSSAIYYLYKEKRNSIKYIINISIIILIFAAMIFTGSRKVLLFCVITYLFQTVMKDKKKFFLSIIVMIIAYICLLKIDILYFYIGHKIDIFASDNTMSLYDYSDNIRKELILNSFKIFLNNPFGIGFGEVAQKLGLYAHNNFLEILDSLGIVGFVIYYSIYVYPLIMLKKINISKELYMYFISSILGLLVIEYFQVTYLYKVPMILIAVIVSCLSLNKSKGGSIKYYE